MMTTYADIYDAPLDQQLRWWRGVDSVPAEYEDDGFFLDTVAVSLSRHAPEGIAALKSDLRSDDPNRRGAALYYLAFPGLADEEVRVALVEAFYSGIRDIRYKALWGFIDLDYFPIGSPEIRTLMESEDERMAALAMVYLSRMQPDDAVEILGAALTSANPRMREYACDEIGDRDIVELSERMRPLLDDAHQDVASSARSNLEFFQDAAE